MTGPVLLITPPPTPNGPLHLGHLAGPYIAGDIAARALRAAGRPVITQCGLDTNQNYVLTRAEADGTSPARVLADYGTLIRQTFSAARIQYDVFAEPATDRRYQALVPALLTELVDGGAVELARARLLGCAGCGRTLHHARVAGACRYCGAGCSGGTCESCGHLQLAGDLVDARSTCCAAAAVPAPRVVPVLRLDEQRERLCEFWSAAVLPPRLRRLIDGYLREGLPAVPLAYPTDWGLPWRDDLRIDVWAEMALANLLLPVRHLDPDRHDLAGYRDGWHHIAEQWTFLGFDNAFYYAILIPALHLAAGVRPPWTGLVINEFYRLAGAKFSTSRRHAIWAHEFLAGHDPGTVRGFLCWDRPDRYESDFSLASYGAFAALDAGGPRLPVELAGAELTRGELALRPDQFDPAVAVRAAYTAGTSLPGPAAELLGLIAGTRCGPLDPAPRPRPRVPYGSPPGAPTPEQIGSTHV